MLRHERGLSRVQGSVLEHGGLMAGPAISFRLNIIGANDVDGVSTFWRPTSPEASPSRAGSMARSHHRRGTASDTTSELVAHIIPSVRPRERIGAESGSAIGVLPLRNSPLRDSPHLLLITTTAPEDLCTKRRIAAQSCHSAFSQSLYVFYERLIGTTAQHSPLRSNFSLLAGINTTPNNMILCF